MMVGASGLFLSESIRKAFAIDPDPGTTFMDAEHVVILMQENRSFDHLYGSLRGVRGFDDPRAIRLPSGVPVWCQSNRSGETYAPFRLDIKNTKVTWLGSLPHSWTDQTDARNHGKMDGWLEAKRSGRKECVGMPFTMGAYTRKDVPFYYDLADAFTICDQHFCSSLTGTMPNRLYLWSGTIRGTRDASGRARVNNGDIEYEDSCRWQTFPDRLEHLGLSWKVYQNEISAVDVGFTKEEAAWLANYGDNPLEWFPQFNVGFSSTHRNWLQEQVEVLGRRLPELRSAARDNPNSKEDAEALNKAEAGLRKAQDRLARFTPEAFETLSSHEKNLFSKGCCTNVGDPDYRKMTSISYQDGATARRMRIPKGDVLHQFREDVKNGKLPFVSWIVAPENFSDHPSSAWYGAWYVSEVMNILTQNPEVWKKTIFILTYDENDGYFDHVAPFVAPHPHKLETGTVSAGMNTLEDFVTMEEELKVKDKAHARESSIGLGFRVPLVIASPWSRGGYVCSQVFDHTSSLQLLEKLISKRLGKAFQEPNISDWRRAVCGDLTSSFRPYHGEKIPLPPFLEKEAFVESIHRAQFKPAPTGYQPMTASQLSKAKESDSASIPMLRQEPGQRPACGLPYDLEVDAVVDALLGQVRLEFKSRTDRLPNRGAGAGFNVYAPDLHRSAGSETEFDRCRSWNFALAAGTGLSHEWKIEHFQSGKAFLRVYGPNGFFREFSTSSNPPIQVKGEADLAAEVQYLEVTHRSGSSPIIIEIVDHSYGAPKKSQKIMPGGTHRFSVNTRNSSGWYDVSVRVQGDDSFSMRYAGRIENGKERMSDPLIGKSLAAFHGIR